MRVLFVGLRRWPTWSEGKPRYRRDLVSLCGKVQNGRPELLLIIVKKVSRDQKPSDDECSTPDKNINTSVRITKMLRLEPYLMCNILKGHTAYPCPVENHHS